MESVVAAGTIFLGQVAKKKKNITEITIRKLAGCRLIYFCFNFSGGVSDSGPAIYQQVNALRDPRINDSWLGWRLRDHVSCVHLPRGEEPCVRLLKITLRPSAKDRCLGKHMTEK